MRMLLILFSTIFLLLISSNKAHTPGTVTVDAFTFEKILRTFDFVWAKFDTKFPSGDKQDQFQNFAQKATRTKKFIIAEIPISDSDDKENQDLAEKYGIKKEDYPVYKLFMKDKSKPIEYTGDKTEDGIIHFLTQRTNLWFGLPGTLEEIDFLAKDFFDASSNKDKKGQKTLLKKALKQAKTLVDKKEQKSAEAYLKIMESIVKNGLEFLQREERRIQKLLEAKITDEKRIELQHRINILRSFKTAKEPKMCPVNDEKNNIFNTP